MKLLGNAPRALFAAVGVGWLLVGCGGTPGSNGEPLGQSQWAVNANDQTAFTYFLGKGLTNFQAAGIVGNLDQESNDDPMAMQQGGAGRGIAQWSVGGRWDTDSGDNATWYAGTQNQSVWSLGLQLDFIWFELTTFSGYGLSSLQQSTNVTDATVAFETDFEGCGVCDQTNRVTYAEQALAAYGSDTASDAGPTTGADAGTPCFVTPLNESGECLLTTTCAAMPGHVSTPGYCPGANDIQCCTGPADDAGVSGPVDAAAADTGAPISPTADSGSPVPAQDSGGSPPEAVDAGSPSTESDAGHPPSTTPAHAPPTDDAAPPRGSKGCAASPAQADGAMADWCLLGLGLLVLRRRRS